MDLLFAFMLCMIGVTANSKLSPSFMIDDHGSGKINNKHRDTPIRKSHEHASAYVQGTFRGFKTTMNIWKPRVESSDEFSLSQLWIISSYDDRGIPRNSIEAGWQVYPQLYGDNHPRLFVYWTADGYNSTGCYNMLCEGFVQVKSIFTVGEPMFSNSSILGSTQVEAEFLVFQDRQTGNWWLKVEGNYVGYWRGSYLPDLADGANEVQCGGEVFSAKNVNGLRHTRTQMGSGLYPDAHYGYAAYHRDIQIIDENLYMKNAHKLVKRTVDMPGCYDIEAPHYSGNSSWGVYFFFGGPGYSRKCR